MAKAVTQSDIYQMNVLYLKYHTYAAVAKETGRSAGTVKKCGKPMTHFNSGWVMPLCNDCDD